MGNTESNVTSGVKKQADTSSIQIYKFVDLKGGGLLVDMMKRAAASKQYAELDHAIKTKVEPFLYNKGKGRLIPVAQLVLLRNKDRPKHKMLPQLKAMENPDDYDIDSDFTTVVNEDEKHDPSKYRDVCWDLKERGAVGETILHLCLLNATSIHADLAKRLLRFYPKLINDIYMCDEYYGENVLHIAIVNEDPSMVKFLLDSGVNYHERCCGTFMCPEDQKASRYDSLDHEWVNVSPLTNYEGYVYWGEYPLAFAACLGQEECYRLMLARGANPDNQDTNGNTVLHLLVIYEKLSTFDMAYEVGASLAIRNNLGLTPLTLAAKLARIDIFFHILNIEREIYWQIGSITCAAYPLSQIDTIDIETGNISKNSALNLVVFGDKDEHLELMDGVLVDLLVAKWNAYVKFRFYRQFTLFFLYFLVSLLCFTLRPGPPTKIATPANATTPQPPLNVSYPAFTGMNVSYGHLNTSLPVRLPTTLTPGNATRARAKSANKTSPPAPTPATTTTTTTTTTTRQETTTNPKKILVALGNMTDKLSSLPRERGKSGKQKPRGNVTREESDSAKIINATMPNANSDSTKSAASVNGSAVAISISLLAKHDADPDAESKHANQVFRGVAKPIEGADERTRYALTDGDDVEGKASVEVGNLGLSESGARLARSVDSAGAAPEDVKNSSGNGTSGNSTGGDEAWWEELGDCRLMQFGTLKAQVRLVAEITMELGSVLYLLAALREARFLGLHMFVENLMTAPSRVMFLLSCVSMQVVPFLRLSCHTEEEDVVAVFIMLTTAPYFLFFCRGFKTVGPFVVMIYRMIMGDLLRFVSIYLVFVMGFSQAYYIIFLSFDNPNTPEGVDDSTANPMSSPMESIMAMFLMSMTNFGDYYGAFERTDHEILAKCLFVIYMGIVAILLVNMLIAMMGNTYQKIAETRNEWQRQWARIVLVVERGVSPQERLKKLMWYSQPMSDGRRALVLRLNQTEEDKEEMKEILEMKRVHVRMVKKRQMGINKLHSNTPSPKSKKI